MCNCWPFLPFRCQYCYFNSHVRPRPRSTKTFSAAWRFAQEIAAYGRACALGREVTSSVLLGGGTPSLMRRKP